MCNVELPDCSQAVHWLTVMLVHAEQIQKYKGSTMRFVQTHLRVSQAEAASNKEYMDLISSQSQGLLCQLDTPVPAQGLQCLW